MACYYFDIKDGAQTVHDDEGSEFGSPEAAVQAAARAAAEIGTGRLVRGDTSAVIIEVRDARNQRICTVTASMTIDWHGPRLSPWTA
jgi:hypothetical protein